MTMQATSPLLLPAPASSISPLDTALPDYLTPDALAAMLGISERTLQRWHAARRGPARCKVGKLIRYRIEAVRDWLAANEERPVVRRADRRGH
ncbi:helix-turn-helix domain-containing protein [Azospirillum isscasi]|uniref:Helix-turn-helix domain-containing protein n=1 Tax=Azospirillum isscasi TaxID=3053926 RepID=A0ABU0WKS2_9PROT|nr:helix-turn-helix domain-containing protein [Azospirillum isscasi]MDQ2104437.1 helix-turn-helix domain-containing protein [Azospirillum isscasi]